MSAHELGAATVVLKLGVLGAGADRPGIVAAEPDPITVVDPAGAGDALVAGCAERPLPAGTL